MARKRSFPYLLVIPGLVFLFVLTIYPFVFSTYVSFFEWDLGKSVTPFIWLENYRFALLSDPSFYVSLQATVSFVALAMVAEFLLGFALALLLDRELRGKRVITLILMLPMVMTPAALSFTWKLMYEPTIGVLNYLLSLSGLPAQPWIVSPSQVIPSLVIIDTWQWTPFVMLCMLAGLGSIPREPLEAAKVDGASRLQTLIHVTIPLLRPVMITVIFFRAIDLFRTFDIIYTLTGGGPSFSSTTINLYTFLEAFWWLHLGYASALSIIMLLVVTTACQIFMKTISYGD